MVKKWISPIMIVRNASSFLNFTPLRSFSANISAKDKSDGKDEILHTVKW